MRVRPWVAGAVAASCTLLSAGCSSSPRAENTSTPASSAQTSTTAAGTAPTTSTPAVNVPVTDQIRARLVAAGAAVNSIPVSQYTGLAPGLTYYGFDKVTMTYWAGARLVPATTADNSAPSQAQVSSQDAGSYYVFKEPKGGSWTAYAAGNTGPNTPCPIAVPNDVVHIWGWPAGACRPSGV